MASTNTKKDSTRTITIKDEEMFVLRIDLSQVEDIEIDGIDPLDYPDFCDAFIIDATYKGRQMTHDELEALNEDSDFVYEKVMEELY